jgi:hypothetical protein
MEIKVWSKDLVKLLYHLTIPFPMFFLVDSLDYNLLSVSQLCKNGYNCLFTDIGVTVSKENGPRVIWLIEFWCLMINTIRELISFLVFVVHRMQD